jgi:uncharacterized protein with FMN-binding domain
VAIYKTALKTKELFPAVAILLSFILAWFAGFLRHRSDIAPFLKQALPSAKHFAPVSNTVYAGLTNSQPQDKKAGFVAVHSVSGYAGPVTVAVGLDKNAKIVAAAIVRHTESPVFFRKVLANGFPKKYVGKSYVDRFEIGADIDAVTGATVSLTALTKAVHLASSDIAANHLGLPGLAQETSQISFGPPEVTLIVLFIFGFIAYSKTISITRYLKWTLLIASLVLIGFIFKKPLSLININSLLLGYWPGFKSNLYWYLLLAAVLIPVILKGKAHYCNCICPFGAAQQILITLGGSKINIPQKYSRFLKFFQRILAWFAVICALLFRNPAIINYEVSATFFTFIGRNWHFVLLAFILVVSLFITRPWCNYLCPVCAVNDYIKLLRSCFARARRPD